MDKTASVTGGNFRAIGETDKVVVTVRAKLAVEQLASGDLKRLNELSSLDVSNVRYPFSRENRKQETYEPDNDQITVSNFSVLRPHLAWRLLRKRKRLHYSVGKGRGVATKRKSRGQTGKRFGCQNRICSNLANAKQTPFVLHPGQLQNNTG